MREWEGMTGLSAWPFTIHQSPMMTEREMATVGEGVKVVSLAGEGDKVVSLAAVAQWGRPIHHSPITRWWW